MLFQSNERRDLIRIAYARAGCYAYLQEDYFRLYDHTAAALKKVDPLIRVGGPATAINAWIPEMIRHCEENGVPLDFISTHHYPTDDPLWNTGMSIEAFFEKLKEEKPESMAGLTAHRRGVLKIMMENAKKEAGNYPLYYTEWNTSSNDMDLRHDVPYSSAFVVKTLIDQVGLVDVYSFWTFSDIFEESSLPTNPKKPRTADSETRLPVSRMACTCAASVAVTAPATPTRA